MLYPQEKESLWQRLGRCYPVVLELIPLLLLGLAVYMAVSNYSSLPDSIPSHFNAQGVADDWDGKKTIFLFPAIVIPIYLLLTLMTVWMSLVHDPKSLINLPDRTKAAVTQEKAEELRLLVVRCLFLMKTLTVALLAYSVYATVEVAHGEAQGLGVTFYVILAAILVCTAFMVWRSLSLALSGHG